MILSGSTGPNLRREGIPIIPVPTPLLCIDLTIPGIAEDPVG
jgi:hypothetical protein